MSVEKCFCGNSKPYDDCCYPYHLGKKQAENAEVLMRSRYSAFASQNAQYLVDTLAPEHRAENEMQLISQSIKDTHWLALRVIKHQPLTATTAEVEFVAFYQQSSTSPGQLHERSRFSKRDGRWYYCDGDILPAVKLGRNDPCWCGSGKKMKKCHWK